MKGFIEIVGKSGKPRLINVSYIEEVTEADKNRCDVYLHGSAESYRFVVDLPYNRVVELIKEAVE